MLSYENHFCFCFVFCLRSTDEKSITVRKPWFDPKETDSKINDDARRAFETVLFVRQRLYTGDRFRRFYTNVVNFAREKNQTKQLAHESVCILESIYQKQRKRK